MKVTVSDRSAPDEVVRVVDGGTLDPKADLVAGHDMQATDADRGDSAGVGGY